MAKYQDNEDKMTEDYSRAKIEAEKAKEKLERVTLVSYTINADFMQRS
jgi:hypothetical protein